MGGHVKQILSFVLVLVVLVLVLFLAFDRLSTRRLDCESRGGSLVSRPMDDSVCARLGLLK